MMPACRKGLSKLALAFVVVHKCLDAVACKIMHCMRVYRCMVLAVCIACATMLVRRTSS